MPKTYLTKQEKLNSAFASWVIGEMKTKKIRQDAAAEKLGITQQAFSYKIRNMAFKYEDLVILFEMLDPDESTLFRLMRGAS